MHHGQQHLHIDEFEPGAADVETFRRDGCVRLGGLLPPASLAALQNAFRRHQAVWRLVHNKAQAEAEAQGITERPEPGKRAAESWHSPGYFDIPRALETDPSYMELLLNPRLV